MDVGIQEDDARYIQDKDAYMRGKKAYLIGIPLVIQATPRLQEMWQMGYTYAREMENV